MTHDDLINETKTAADESGLKLTKTDVKKLLDLVFNEIFSELENGGNYRIPGIGTLKTVDVAARTARNPATGETIQVPAKKSVKFKIASELKKALNG
jgi:nucleoid DNA-binding protein